MSTLSSAQNYTDPGPDVQFGECSSSCPIAGTLADSTSKLNKASHGMPGGSRLCLCETLSKPDDLHLPSTIWRSSVFLVETEGLQAKVVQNHSNTWESRRSRTEWACQMSGTCIHFWKVFFSSRILIFHGSQSILKAK